MNKLILLVAILCGIIQAQTSQDKCTIEGTVLNSVTGEGVKKAQVSIRSTDRQSSQNLVTVANASGHFSVGNLDPGRYFVSANGNGFINPSRGAPGPNRTGLVDITLQSGDSLRDIDIRLIPQGVIAGRVLDEDGDPVISVSVQAYRLKYQQGRKQLVGESGSSSNDLGEFRIPRLLPGKYFLLATAQVYELPGWVSASGSRHEVAYAPTYYPGALQADSASPLNITPGAQVGGIDIRLVKVRAVRVGGRVVDALNKPLFNASVTLEPRNLKIGGSYITVNAIMVGDGTFQFYGVQPGSYVLASDYIQGSVHMTGRMPLEVGAIHMDDVVVTVAPPPELHGQMVVDGKAAVQLSNVYIQLASGSQGSSAVVRGPDGSFTMKDLRPERYDVDGSSLPPSVYVKSVQLGNVDVTDTGLDFTQGVPAVPLTVFVRAGAGQVEGIVQDENHRPCAAAMVVLIPESSKRGSKRRYKEAFADEKGHYSITGIRPGDYKLFAWYQIEGEAYLDPDFLKSFESKGEPVTIKENGHEDKSLTIISSAL